MLHAFPAEQHTHTHGLGLGPTSTHLRASTSASSHRPRSQRQAERFDSSATSSLEQPSVSTPTVYAPSAPSRSPRRYRALPCAGRESKVMVTGGHGQHGRLHLVAAPTHFCMSRTSSFHFLICDQIVPYVPKRRKKLNLSFPNLFELKMQKGANNGLKNAHNKEYKRRLATVLV